MSRAGNQNSAKRADDSRPPWADWEGTDAELTIRFIESYIVTPKGHGAGEPFVLAEFQKDAIRRLFAPGVRSATFTLARGNGKSTFTAAVALARLFLDPNSPQIPLIAVTLKQIENACYSVAVRMTQLHPELQKRCIIYKAIGNKAIHTPWNDGHLFPMSSDVDGLQGADPSLAIVDEIGFVSPDSWNALYLASGKRPSSLCLGIGTTGHADSALKDLYDKHKAGKEMPGHEFILYEAEPGCALDDPEAWAAANPALGEGFLALDALASAVEITPENQFRAFRLNQWSNLQKEEPWLGPKTVDLLDSLVSPIELEHGAELAVGVDVSLKYDSTSVVMVQEQPDGTWHAKAKIWFPGQGVVPLNNVADYVLDLHHTYRLVGVAYDPRFFEASAQDLEDQGVPMVEVPQSPTRMVPIVGNTYRALVEKRITLDPDPAFRQQLSNAVSRPSESGFTLQKQKRGFNYKIDAAIALCLAMSCTGVEALGDDAFKIW